MNAEIWRAGERIAKEIGEQDIAWALTKEAALVFRRQPSPGPRGYPTKSPIDPLVTQGEWFAMEVERLKDGITAPPEPENQMDLDAGSVDRADIIQKLWAKQTGKHQKRLLKGIWLHAGGMSMRAVGNKFGYSATWLGQFKSAGCSYIEIKLTKRPNGIGAKPEQDCWRA